ncbi:hypothetical protein F0A16_21435 [Salinicola corii]|uniref:Uncharacterized protein n=1 Tax=Salinicola corii TaxID=2606937 RepID=A0A640W6Z4_9GAMM|nr:hypothetical protein [Salinicola corii]KAA0015139.1 hypothetical protein F0A16_21435 [Salinicola corii]
MDSRQIPEKLDVQCLQQALVHAIRLTMGNDTAETQCAWLTEDCVWALYPAIYPDIQHFLQRGTNALSQAFPDKHELLEQLLKAGLIATPRATAVREFCRDRWFSQLNLALEIDPDLIWRPGETRPELCHLTHAMGPYRRQVADLMGLPPSPVDHPQLCLGTLHSMPEAQADRFPALVNPRVVLAIYWQPEDLAPEAETRSIS